MTDFMNAIFNGTEQKTVIAYFTNGESANYTELVLELLKTEPDIFAIADGETGEIIFER